MYRGFVAALALLAFASSAQAKPAQHLAVSGASLTPVISDRIQFATVSRQAASTAALSMVSEDALGDGIPVLSLVVTNAGPNPYGLAADNVRVTTEKGQPVAILSYDEMAKRAHKKLAGSRFGTGLTNFLVAYAAAASGTQTQYGHYSGTTYTPYGAVSTSGTVTTTTYNADEAARNMQNARVFIDQNNAKLKGKELGLQEQAQQVSFAPATVFPKGVAATYIPLDKLPKGAKSLTVQVTLGSEQHQFQVDVVAAPVVGWPEPTGPDAPALNDAAVNAWVSAHVDQKGWSFVGYDERGAYFADLNSLEHTAAGTLRMWFKAELFQTGDFKGLGVRSERGHWELNCAKKEVRVVALESHPFSNLQAPVINDDEPDASWWSPPANSLYDRFATQMCASQT